MQPARTRSAAFWATMILTLGAGAGRAAVIAVDGTTCNLGDAILSANGDAAVGGCTAGAGADTLILGADVVLAAAVTAPVEGGPSGLPAISSEIAIEAGAGSSIERSNLLDCDSASTPFRLIEISAGGDLSLVGLNLRRGCLAPPDIADTPSGGAILVREGGSLRLDDCLFENNRAHGTIADFGGDARGGAIAVLGGRLQIAGSTFTSNEALGEHSRGGALACDACEITSLTTSRFLDNRASLADAVTFAEPDAAGGAISLKEASTETLAYLELRGNVAGFVNTGGNARGGGLDISGGTVGELRDSLFEANSALGTRFSGWGLGGGLANSGSIDAILRTTFKMNQALGPAGFSPSGLARGGGVDNTGRIGRLVSVTFSANWTVAEAFQTMTSANSLGGGLANSGSIGLVAASTFVGNSSHGYWAYSAGGGIYDGAQAGSGPSAGLSAVNSLFSTNQAVNGPDCRTTGAFLSAGSNMVQSTDSNCAFSGAGDIVGVDPLPLPLADYGCTVTLPSGACLPTVALQATSPALDSGLCDESGSEIDARGAVRPLDLAGIPNASGSDGCDIGAFELDGALATVHLGLSVAESIDPVASGSGVGNLVYTVSLASLGSATATGIAVAVVLPLPTGVTLDSVAPSVGSWDGATWTVPALPSGAHATLTFVLTVGFGTAGEPDALSLFAAVTAATGHNGEFATDVETTSVIEGVFFDGFESGDTFAWSLTVGGS